MRTLTYEQLRVWLGTLSEEQLRANVVVMIQDTNELIPMHSCGVPASDDRLDDGHPVLFL